MFNKMSLYRVKKGFVYLRYFGPKEFLIRLKERIRIQKIDYEKWYENHRRTEEELESQRLIKTGNSVWLFRMKRDTE